ncbi:MAG: hypothetical protein ACJAX5_003248 [Patiriisocius sp.]|jgi:hypothetical protein
MKNHTQSHFRFRLPNYQSRYRRYSILVRRYFLKESLKFELLGIHHRNDGDRLIRFSADYELTSNTTLGFFSDTFDDKDRIGF